MASTDWLAGGGDWGSRSFGFFRGSHGGFEHNTKALIAAYRR
jgi:hypothetical protein